MTLPMAARIAAWPGESVANGRQGLACRKRCLRALPREPLARDSLQVGLEPMKMPLKPRRIVWEAMTVASAGLVDRTTRLGLTLRISSMAGPWAVAPTGVIRSLKDRPWALATILAPAAAS